MTRPATLSEAAERIAAGVPREIAIGEFLDTFYTAPSPDARYASLAPEPAISGDAKLDALLGAIGEYLAKQFKLGRVPPWVGRPERILDLPWHTTDTDSDAMREYLTVSSPAEFVHHNIFTEAVPLRRATRPAIT